MTAIRRIALPAWAYVIAIVLSGCMADRSPQISANAQLAAEGTKKVSYRAPDDGKVYVFDQNDNRVVYYGDVAKGELVTVDPDASRVTVGDKVVAEKSLHNGNSHRIFFDDSAEAKTAKHTVIEERRETSNSSVR
jgi:hypothetical protein